MAGRPVIEITPERRKDVERLSGYGMTQEQIARVLDIDCKTLVKHCRAELDSGKDKALDFAVNQLFRNIKKGKEASLIFYLKTQHRWKEVTQTELTGADSAPLMPSISVTLKRGDEKA